MLRFLLLGIALGLPACGSHPSAPTITGLTYAPMQLAVGAAGAVTGDASFRDPDGDMHLVAIGFVDPQGLLTEAAPRDTGTEGMLFGTVPFSASVTPKLKGTYQLSLRFIDDTGLSSPASTGAIDVE